MKLRVLSKHDVMRILDMPMAIKATREAFLALNQEQVTMPQRLSVETKAYAGTSLFMPAGTSSQLGMKVVSIYDDNAMRSLPVINGAILLLDSETGVPMALLEASVLTAVRTGAVSGLATDLLARDDAERVTIIGAGVQARTQLAAVQAVRSIKHVSIYSRTREHAEIFASELSDMDVRVCDSVESACQSSDVICTATGATSPLVSLDMVKTDCHVNAIGSHTPHMQELSGDLLAPGQVVVDQILAAKAEAGEIINALSNQLIKESDLVELGQLTEQPNEALKCKRTVFKSVGLAIQDLAVANAVFSAACDRQIGSEVDWQ